MDKNTFNHNNYRNTRSTKQTLIIDTGNLTAVTAAETTFSFKLQDTLIIDTKSDIYLDSLTTFNCKANTDTNSMGFIIHFPDFNQSNNISNDEKINNKLFIPNESNSNSNNIIHKGKKLNYICSINPTVLRKINFTITDLNNASIFPATISSGRIVLELLFIENE